MVLASIADVFDFGQFSPTLEMTIAFTTDYITIKDQEFGRLYICHA